MADANVLAEVGPDETERVLVAFFLQASLQDSPVALLKVRHRPSVVCWRCCREKFCHLPEGAHRRLGASVSEADRWSAFDSLRESNEDVLGQKSDPARPDAGNVIGFP